MVDSFTEADITLSFWLLEVNAGLSCPAHIPKYHTIRGYIILELFRGIFHQGASSQFGTELAVALLLPHWSPFGDFCPHLGTSVPICLHTLFESPFGPHFTQNYESQADELILKMEWEIF